MSSTSPASPPSKPAAIKHLEQARQNYTVYQELKNGTHYDWQAIVLFYTAMHLVQAYFVQEASTGFDIPKEHDRRASLVYQKLPPIGGDFEHLFKESMAARYYLDQPRPTAERVRVCEAKFDKIAAHLKARGYALKAP
jgi:hypothetical protein